MKVRSLLVALALSIIPIRAVQAQVSGVEVGTSLASLMVHTNGSTTTTFGIPSGGFGLVNPSFYLSFPVTSRLAVEPRIGFVFVSREGETDHLLNLAGQVAFFFNRSAVSSPFVFGSVGLLNVSGGDDTPSSVSAGAGYRWLSGGRLAIRLEGSVTHYTNDGGNAITLSVSLGGVFGGRR